MQKAKELHQEREGEKEEDADFKDDLMARAEVEVLKQNAAEFWIRRRHYFTGAAVIIDVILMHFIYLNRCFLELLEFMSIASQNVDSACWKNCGFFRNKIKLSSWPWEIRQHSSRQGESHDHCWAQHAPTYITSAWDTQT